MSGKLPVPESETVCGESGAASVMASEPVSAPEIEGVKVTFTLQDAPAPMAPPHVLLEMAKFPVAAMELMFRAAVLVFFKVTVFDALVVPTICGLKARLRGEGLTMGAFATVKGNAANAAHGAPLGKLSTHTWKAPGFAI